MSGTLIYTPGHSIIIDSAVAGPIDVTEDVSQGSISIRENGSHSLSFTLENPNLKYNGVFAPNDRVVVQLKRVTWLQIFAGYLDGVPYFSAYPRPIDLRATCPIKVLRNWPWDSGSDYAYNLINGPRDTQDQDGGLAGTVARIMNSVAGWPMERIHIGSVPSSWRRKYEKIMGAIEDAVAETEALMGANPYVLAGGYGSSSGTTISGDGSEYLFEDDSIDVALAVIREMESGNDYGAINKGNGVGDWATGAYQFIDSTWRSYNKEYERAYLAPVPVQDAVATAYLRHFVDTYGHQLMVIPIAWYLPKALDDHSLLDTTPSEDEGNQATIREYAQMWINQYVPTHVQMKNAPPPMANSTTAPSSISSYPIPAGVSQLKNSEVAWGGFQNGVIPASAMAYSGKTGQGHPLAVKSWLELCDAAAAAGINPEGSMYRDLAGQQALVSGMGVSVPGTSNHGWGLAIDVDALTGSGADFDSPVYVWLKENAHRWGWGNPPWAQEGGSKQEPWHWEFLAIYSFLGATFDPQGTTANVDPFFGTNVSGSYDQLFGALAMWTGSLDSMIDPESEVLVGFKATMNDSPLMNIVSSLLTTSARSWCSAPNGDFMSWFPDYWGEFGSAGIMNVETIELKDFSVYWSDDPLVTHQFVVGASNPENMGPLPAGVIDAVQAVQSRGVATVEIPGFLEAVINLPTGHLNYPWMRDSDLLLRRFGARVSRENIPTIYGPEQEFWYAVSRFTKAWASQFSANVPVTFMPELWPGMLLRIPDYGVQFYITGVSHSWSMSNGGGYSTTVSVIAPSATDGSGFFFLPRAGNPHRPKPTPMRAV